MNCIYCDQCGLETNFDEGTMSFLTLMELLSLKENGFND